MQIVTVHSLKQPQPVCPSQANTPAYNTVNLHAQIVLHIHEKSLITLHITHAIWTCISCTSRPTQNHNTNTPEL